jgi:hypothetical protein
MCPNSLGGALLLAILARVCAERSGSYCSAVTGSIINLLAPATQALQLETGNSKLKACAILSSSVRQLP